MGMVARVIGDGRFLGLLAGLLASHADGQVRRMTVYGGLRHAPRGCRGP